MSCAVTDLLESIAILSPYPDTAFSWNGPINIDEVPPELTQVSNTELISQLSEFLWVCFGSHGQKPKQSAKADEFYSYLNREYGKFKASSSLHREKTFIKLKLLMASDDRNFYLAITCKTG